MSRFTGSRGKKVRRYGVNIYGNPKFDRLLARRPNAPGIQGAQRRRRKVSEYGEQLIEKQKLKDTYGLRERQFRNVYKRALDQQGITGDNMLVLLESRLDNIAYRMGLAPTRNGARQLVLHGHLKVNDRRVNIPSFNVRAGDVVTVKDSTRSQNLVRKNLEESASRDVPDWLAIDAEHLKGEVVRLPMREDIPSVADEQKVVELYSK